TASALESRGVSLRMGDYERSVLSPLDPRRAAFSEGLHLFERRHGRVTGERSQQRAMGPAQPYSFLLWSSGEQTIKKSGGETIATADAIIHVQFAGGGDKSLAVDPGDGAPTVAVGRVDLAQGGGDDLNLGMLLGDLADHADEGARVQLGFGGDFGAGNAQAHLQIFLIADEHIDVFNDSVQDRYRA